MGRVFFIFVVSLILLATKVSSAQSHHYAAKIVSGIYSDVVAVLIKWIWSPKATSKPASAISPRPIMKFESGYYVETVFDGTKLGVEPYAVEILPNGDLLILDSTNSNLHKISSSLSLYSRPKLITGSADGISGYVDGKARDAKLNHPTGITADDKGNIYVADAENMAIRRITETGVTTIAGGKWGRSSGHIDGPSEDAKLSSDFDLVYDGSSCSLLVIDRGNKAIREILLHNDDCTSASQYGSDFPLGVAILVAACFFGYMLALLQERVSSLIWSRSVPRQPKLPPCPYQKPIKSIRPPLIPTEDIVEEPEHSIYNNWPPQESFVRPPKDEPPSTDLRTHHKTYPSMSNDSRKMQELRQSRILYHAQDNDQQYHQPHHISTPQTFTEQAWDNTEEFQFGAVREQVAKRKKTMAIKPVDHGRRFYNHAGFQYHYHSNGYDYGTSSYN